MRRPPGLVEPGRARPLPPRARRRRRRSPSRGGPLPRTSSPGPDPSDSGPDGHPRRPDRAPDPGPLLLRVPTRLHLGRAGHVRPGGGGGGRGPHRPSPHPVLLAPSRERRRAADSRRDLHRGHPDHRGAGQHPGVPGPGSHPQDPAGHLGLGRRQHLELPGGALRRLVPRLHLRQQLAERGQHPDQRLGDRAGAAHHRPPAPRLPRQGAGVPPEQRPAQPLQRADAVAAPSSRCPPAPTPPGSGPPRRTSPG